MPLPAPQPKRLRPVLVSPAAAQTRWRTGSARSAASPSRMPHPLHRKLQPQRRRSLLLPQWVNITTITTIIITISPRLREVGAFAGPEQRPTSGPIARDVRPRTPLAGASVSRSEAAVRKLTQDWALACNNKQLDDLVDLYGADAVVLRPNVPPVRGTAAIREFFFSVLDAGLGEVEMDTLRVEIFGDLAYEAGRCQMLVPFYGKTPRRAWQISAHPGATSGRLENPGRLLVQ